MPVNLEVQTLEITDAPEEKWTEGKVSLQVRPVSQSRVVVNGKVVMISVHYEVVS